MKKLLKCALWFVKEYANVGIALALFILIGLQIEKQYRSERYFGNCIDAFKKDDTENLFKYKDKVGFCASIRSDDVPSFNYHKGRINKYLER
jgi:hypothetical protein